MGDKQGRKPTVKRICWWLVDFLSRTLEPDEREAVRGDFVESGETGSRALRGLFGLIARRQAALWMHWQPWLAVVGLVVPLGVMFCVISRRVADSSAVYVWLYANNWDWAFLRIPAFYGIMPGALGPTLVGFLMLGCWSWAGGLLLGAASHRTIQVNTVLFCLLLFFGELMGRPRYFLHWVALQRARTFSGNNPVFALTFYRVIFPLIVQAALVIGPCLWGMRHGVRIAKLRPLLRTILWAAAIATLVTMWRFPSLYSYNQLVSRFGWKIWQMRVLQLFVYWPFVYLATGAIGRRWHVRSASTKFATQGEE